MVYRTASKVASRELTMPYMPTEASERALYATSMVMPFGGMFVLATPVAPLFGLIGAGIVGLGGFIYQRTRRSPIRFVLDEVALEVEWPHGSVHGTALRIACDQVDRAAVAVLRQGIFTICLVDVQGRHIELNEAPLLATARHQTKRLQAFLDKRA